MSGLGLVRIPRDVTLGQLDELDFGEGVRSMSVPASLRADGDFSVESALIQILGTVARKSPDCHLQLTAAPRQDQISKYAGYAYSLFGHWLFPQIDTPDQSLATEVAAVHQKTRKSMYAGEFGETSSKKTKISANEVNLISFFDESDEFLVPLYLSGGRLKDEVSLTDLVRLVAEEIVPSSWRDALTERLKGDIGSLLYELMSNVSRHAKKDERGDRYARNAMLLSFRYRYVLERDVADQSKRAGRSTFATYLLDQYRLLPSGSTGLPCLEVSVLDLGPGFYRAKVRGLGGGRIDLSEINLETERSVTANCFDPGVSSYAGPGSGYGLDHVRRILRDRKGFLRLRTGRVALALSAKAAGGRSGLTNYYYPPAGGGAVRALPEVVGSCVSIVIPLQS